MPETSSARPPSPPPPSGTPPPKFMSRESWSGGAPPAPSPLVPATDRRRVVHMIRGCDVRAKEEGMAGRTAVALHRLPRAQCDCARLIPPALRSEQCQTRCPQRIVYTAPCAHMLLSFLSAARRPRAHQQRPPALVSTDGAAKLVVRDRTIGGPADRAGVQDGDVLLVCGAAQTGQSGRPRAMGLQAHRTQHSTAQCSSAARPHAHHAAHATMQHTARHGTRHRVRAVRLKR